MPLIGDDPLPQARGAVPGLVEPLAELPDPNAPTLGASVMQTSNPVVNVLELLARKTPPAVAGYDLDAHVKSLDPRFIENYRDWFVGSASPQETEQTMHRIMREEQYRERIAAAGWVGEVLEMGASMASPDIAFALGRAARVGAGMARGAAEVAIVTAGQESVFQANQQLRSAEESYTNVAVGTVLGGILGGVAGHMTKAELKAAHKVVAGNMGLSQSDNAIPTAAGAEVATGAVPTQGFLNTRPGVRQASVSAGTGVRKVIGWLGKPNQVLESMPFPEARRIGITITDDGQRMQEALTGGTAVPGGTIENRTGVWEGQTIAQAYPEWDKAWNDYHYANGNIPSLAPTIRSRIAAEIAKYGGPTTPTYSADEGFEWAKLTGSAAGKFTRQEMNIEAGKAANMLDEHPVPEAAAMAASFRKHVDDKLREAGILVKLLPESVRESVVGAKSYFSRVYLQEKIREFRNVIDPESGKSWMGMLVPLLKSKLLDEFQGNLETFKVSNKFAEQQIEDLKLGAADFDSTVDMLRNTLENLEAWNPQLVAQAELIRALKAAGDKLAARELAKDPDYRAFIRTRNQLRERLHTVRSSVAGLTERQQRALAVIEKYEDANDRNLNRLLVHGMKLVADFDKLDDAKLDAEISKLRTEFAQAAKKFDEAEEKLRKYGQGDELFKHQMSAERLDALAERLGQAEEFDRAAAWMALNDGVDALRRQVGRSNDSRAVRAEKLRVLAKDLAKRTEVENPEVTAATDAVVAKKRELQAALRDPKRVEEANGLKAEVKKMEKALQKKLEADPAVSSKVKTLEMKKQEAEDELVEKWGKHGMRAFDAEAGTIDIDKYVQDVADDITNKILGLNPTRAGSMDLLQGERGPELERFLHIQSQELFPWLELDIEKISKYYVRKMAPDIEIVRAFGSLNMEQPFAKLTQEFNEAVAKPGITGKESKRLHDDYDKAQKAIEIMVSRLRGSRGLPDDPGSIPARLGELAMNVNVGRLMGGSVIASAGDPIRYVSRYGLTNTFANAWVPLVTGLKQSDMLQREALLANAGNDISIDTRARAATDLLETGMRGKTAIERGAQYATSKFGLISLMAPWNAFHRRATGMLAVLDITKASKAWAEGKITPKQMEAMAANQINEQMARRIWDHVQGGKGGTEVDGVWYPNTEEWLRGGKPDNEAIMAFRSAVLRETNNAIIMPGVAKPGFMDANMGFRVLTQFQSFGMTANTKMIVAGLQQADAAALGGFVMMMGMGTLSYYLASVAAGGEQYKKMQGASPGVWAAEALDRSGFMGSLTTVNRALENTPLGGLRHLTGAPLSRQQPGNLAGALLGPTADLAKRSGNILFDIMGGKVDGGTLHDSRALIYMQNVSYIRYLLDKVEAGIVDATGLKPRKGQ